MKIDSHCHLNDEALLPEIEAILSSAKKEGVGAFLVIGWDYESSKKAVEIAQKYPCCFAAVGFQPENIEGASIQELSKIEELAKEDKVIAIGEIGLDYHWYKEEKDRQNQKEWFIAQIELANRLSLPISIHAREASGDVLGLLSKHPVSKKGVLHCYSGSKETMRELEKLGFYIGFDGPITFKNAVQPKECVQDVSFDRLLLETDSPYLSPVPYRGKRNEPAYISEIYQQTALLRNIDGQDLEKQVQANFERLFRVKL